MSTDNAEPEVTEPQAPEAIEPEGESPEGAQPVSDPAPSTPAQEKQPGSDTPMIPKPRFDEINQRMHAAEARARALEQQINPSQVPQQPKSGPPKQEDFGTYEEYVRADARYEARQEYARMEQENRQRAVQQTEQQRQYSAEVNWTSKSAEASAKHTDFMDVVAPLRLNPMLEGLIKASPVAGDLAYHLGKNRAELEARLNSMHPLDAAAEMGRIEAKLTGASGQPQPKVSQMPKPMTPVNGGKSTGGGGSGLDKALAILYPT
jgi:hypothetical protein